MDPDRKTPVRRSGQIGSLVLACKGDPFCVWYQCSFSLWGEIYSKQYRLAPRRYCDVVSYIDYIDCYLDHTNNCFLRRINYFINYVDYSNGVIEFIR